MEQHSHNVDLRHLHAEIIYLFWFLSISCLQTALGWPTDLTSWQFLNFTHLFLAIYFLVCFYWYFLPNSFHFLKVPEVTRNVGRGEPYLAKGWRLVFTLRVCGGQPVLLSACCCACASIFDFSLLPLQCLLLLLLHCPHSLPLSMTFCHLAIRSLIWAIHFVKEFPSGQEGSASVDVHFVLWRRMGMPRRPSLWHVTAALTLILQPIGLPMADPSANCLWTNWWAPLWW